MVEIESLIFQQDAEFHLALGQYTSGSPEPFHY